MPSIETEIENGEDTSEDVTEPNHIKMFSQLVSCAASDDNASARTRVWPREATYEVLVNIASTFKQQFSEKFALDITKQVKILE